MPMDKNSTLFLSFTDITVDKIDILEDAFLSDIDYGVISKMIREMVIEPPPGVIDRIIDLV